MGRLWTAPAGLAGARVAEDARARGATVGVVDGLATGDRVALLDGIARELAFPSWFGRNLDALHDCLTDLSWQPTVEVVLVWSHHQRLRAADPPGYRAVLAVLGEAVAETADTERPVSVVLTER